MPAEFKFYFNGVGQGDCCFVRCPDGKVVVVDCGRSTDAWTGEKPWHKYAPLCCVRRTWRGATATRLTSSS